MTEPKIVVEHREDLWWLLAEAAQLEHMIMCQYLFVRCQAPRLPWRPPAARGRHRLDPDRQLGAAVEAGRGGRPELSQIGQASRRQAASQNIHS
jgi:hypothetical protein